MRYLHLILVFAIAILFASCSITNSVHFNKNFSGTYTMELDLGDMIEFMMEMDSTMSDSLDNWEESLGGEQDFKKMEEKIEAIEGISNFNADFSTVGVMNFTFDFEDTDALNRGLEAFNDEMEKSQAEQAEADGDMGFGAPSLDLTQEYSVNGKTLMFKANNFMAAAPEEEGMDMMGDMSELFDYYMEFTFDRKVKTTTYSGFALIKEDAHTVKTRMDLSEVDKDQENLTIEVKLK